MGNGIDNFGIVNNATQETLDAIELCDKAGHVLEIVNIGRCLTRYICEVCKISWDIDSSD